LHLVGLLYIIVLYSLEFTVHQCKAERMKEGEQTVLMIFVPCIVIQLCNVNQQIADFSN